MNNSKSLEMLQIQKLSTLYTQFSSSEFSSLEISSSVSSLSESEKIYLSSVIYSNLFFFNSIFTFFYKQLRIIIFTCSKNRIDQNYK